MKRLVRRLLAVAGSIQVSVFVYLGACALALNELAIHPTHNVLFRGSLIVMLAGLIFPPRLSAVKLTLSTPALTSLVALALLLPVRWEVRVGTVLVCVAMHMSAGKSGSRSAYALICLTVMSIGVGLSFAWPAIDAHLAAIPRPVAECICRVAGTTAADAGLAQNRTSIPMLAEHEAFGTLLPLTLRNLQASLFLFLLLCVCVYGVMQISRPLRFVAVSLLISVLACVAGAVAVYATFSTGGIPAVSLYRYESMLALFLSILWGVGHYAFLSHSPVGETDLRFSLMGQPLASWVAAASLGACVVFPGLSDPGVKNDGRILLDESHSRWEKSDIALNSDRYGVKTVYNYYDLAELLGRHYEVSKSYEPVSAELLKNYDVLILKTPTSPYSPEEIACIREFTKRGGGIWLIGEHTNIFGINTYLNAIIEPWGVRFNADAVGTETALYATFFEHDEVPLYHHACGKRTHDVLVSKPVLNHPILAGGFNYMNSLTSCSVTAPFWADTISIARGTFSDPAEYSSNTHFGNLALDAEDRWGDMLQAVSFSAGKGRIALWSDSTVFSNFSMFMPGVPQLSLGYVGWLNRSDLVPSHVKTGVFLCLAGLCIFCFLRVGSRGPGWTVPANLGLLLALSVGLYGAQAWNAFWYKLPDVTKGYRTVAFVEEFSHIDIPAKSHIHEKDPIAFETFYVTPQRQGYMPQYVTRLTEAASSDAICMMNPIRPFEAPAIEFITRFVSEGGTLFIFFNDEDKDDIILTSIHRVTELFRSMNIDCHFHRANGDSLTAPVAGSLIAPDIWTDIRYRLSIHGPAATPLLETADNTAFAAVINYGEGRIVLNTLAHLYSNKNMGEPGHVPTIEQLEHLKALYDIWKMMEGPRTLPAPEQNTRLTRLQRTEP